MKKLLAFALVLALCLSLCAGLTACVKEDTGKESVSTKSDLDAALEYVKTLYKKATEKTARDFKRIGAVPVNGTTYEVVWSVDVAEENVKVVKEADGMVTIDVNEAAAEDVSYTLTATISDGEKVVSHSWKHIVPKANLDFASIVDAAYALEVGAAMDQEVKLTGVISGIPTPYDAGYKNITVTINVVGIEGKPIECYRLKGEGAEALKVGDTITVVGTLSNYNGKVQFGAGCILEAVVKGEEVAAPTDPGQILKDAYALSDGASTKYEATLTGKITTINTPYNDSYKNVSVTIVVDGYAEYPILCYRIKGDGADKLLIGDTITVKGYITNYAGTIEFAAGSALMKVEKTGTEVKAPSDPKQIVKAAYALRDGESLPYKATLTGKITKIRYPYDAAYDNISVFMAIDGMSDKPIECYRLKGSGADKIGTGDTITVTGVITNYKGSVQFAQGCTLDSWKDTGKTEGTDGKKVSVKEAINIGTSMDHDTYTELKYKVTGVITEVYNTVYGNMKITDGEGNILTIYGTYSADGKTRYDAMSVKPVAGDTVTIYGPIGQYNGTAQIKNGWIVEHKPGTTEPEPEPEVPELPTEDGAEISIKVALAAGTAMEHNTYTELKYKVTGIITEVYNTQYGNMKITDADGNVLTVYGTYSADGETRYDAMEVKPVAGDKVTVYGILGQFNGTAQIKNGWIVAHTLAADLKPELPTEEGAEITIADALTFGAAMEHNTYTELKYKVKGIITEVYNEKYGNMKIADAEGNVLTIYGSYSADGSTRYDAMEVKPVAGDIVTILGVLGQFNGTVQIKNGWVVEHGVPIEPEVPELPAEDGAEITIADALAAGAAMEQNTYTELKYSVSGVITEVYNEKYGNMKIADAEGNVLTIYGTYSEDGETRYDSLEVKPVAGDMVTIYGVLGQYKDTVQIKNGWIIAYAPALPTEDGAEITVAHALAAGSFMEHNTYTELKYKVTGVIAEVTNEKYGNMMIIDAEGNALTIYGAYSADGETRYDGLEVKPVAGDTVTIYGVLGQYKETVQIKNGWIVAHVVPSEPEPEVPEQPAEEGDFSITDVVTNGAAIVENAYNDIKDKVSDAVKDIYDFLFK